MGINAFLDDVRRTLRLRHYSFRTEEVYLHRIKEFIYFHGKRHPQTLGVEEIRRYLTYLAVDQQVAASTQNVARSALLFVYRDVLNIPLDALTGVAPAKRPERLPVVFTSDEVKRLLAQFISASDFNPWRHCGARLIKLTE